MPCNNTWESTEQTPSVGVSSLDDVDSLRSVYSTENLSMRNVDKRIKNTIYDRYSFSRDNCKNNMPIHKCREEIIDAIQKNPVIVLQGDTGLSLIHI